MDTWNSWLLEQTDQLVAASNFTVSTIMVFLCISVIFAIRNLKFSKQTDIFYMLVGVALEAFGWALHRFYWGLWRTYRLYGNEEMDQWFVSNGYLALIPITFILWGLVLITGPIISFVVRQGRWVCYGIAMAAVFSIYWFMYWQLGDAFVADKARKELQKQETSTVKTIRPRIIHKDLDKD